MVWSFLLPLLPLRGLLPKPCKQCLLKLPQAHHPLPSRDLCSCTIWNEASFSAPHSSFVHTPPSSWTAGCSTCSLESAVPGGTPMQAAHAAKFSQPHVLPLGCSHHALRTLEFTAQTHSGMYLRGFQGQQPGLTQFAISRLKPAPGWELAGTWVFTGQGSQISKMAPPLPPCSVHAPVPRE